MWAKVQLGTTTCILFSSMLVQTLASIPLTCPSQGCANIVSAVDEVTSQGITEAEAEKQEDMVTSEMQFQLLQASTQVASPGAAAGDEEITSEASSADTDTFTPAPLNVKLSPAARRNQIKRQIAAQKKMRKLMPDAVQALGVDMNNKDKNDEDMTDGDMSDEDKNDEDVIDEDMDEEGMNEDQQVKPASVQKSLTYAERQKQKRSEKLKETIHSQDSLRAAAAEERKKHFKQIHGHHASTGHIKKPADEVTTQSLTITPAPLDTKLSPAARRNQLKRQVEAQINRLKRGEAVEELQAAEEAEPVEEGNDVEEVEDVQPEKPSPRKISPAEMRTQMRSQDMHESVQRQERLRTAAAQERKKHFDAKHHVRKQDVDAQATQKDDAPDLLAAVAEDPTTATQVFTPAPMDIKLSPGARRHQVQRQSMAARQLAKQAIKASAKEIATNDALINSQQLLGNSQQMFSTIHDNRQKLQPVLQPVMVPLPNAATGMAPRTVLAPTNPTPEEMMLSGARTADGNFAMETPAPMDSNLSPAAKRNQLKRQLQAKRREMQVTNEARARSYLKQPAQVMPQVLVLPPGSTLA